MNNKFIMKQHGQFYLKRYKNYLLTFTVELIINVQYKGLCVFIFMCIVCFYLFVCLNMFFINDDLNFHYDIPCQCLIETSPGFLLRVSWDSQEKSQETSPEILRRFSREISMRPLRDFSWNSSENLSEISYSYFNSYLI